MIEAKKSFGQNFLKDQNIIDKISNSIDVTKDDIIIEIGPGKGALTKELRKKPSRLIAFEIDERMKDVLSQYEDEKTKIIYSDILSVDLKCILKDYKYRNLYLIANLPYYITSPIVDKMLSLNIFNEITIMVQKEVADRFCASPRTSEYGLMTVFINTNYTPKKMFNVKNTCFEPAPKVDSAVVNLKKKDSTNIVNDLNYYKEFLSKAFSHKRKTLKNNLGTELFSKVYEILINYNYPQTVRAEEIPTEIYIEICNNLSK